jgi:hypothetical protein
LQFTQAAALCALEFAGEAFSLGHHRAEFTAFVGTFCEYVTQFTLGVTSAAGTVQPYAEAVQKTHTFHKLLAQVCWAGRAVVNKCPGAARLAAEFLAFFGRSFMRWAPTT